MDFHDRRVGRTFDAQRGSEEYLDQLHGSGQEGFQHLFPGEQSDALTPWRSAGGLKGHHPYERAKVREAVSGPPHLSEIDPRHVLSTQPSITRAGVDYYLNSDQFRRSGRTFADQGNPGNAYPVVYARKHPLAGRTDNLLLSGHHRAAAALLRGEPLRARFVEGGFEPR